MRFNLWFKSFRVILFGFCVIIGVLLFESILTISSPGFTVSSNLTFLGVLLLDNIRIMLSPAFFPTCSPVFVAAVVTAFVAAVFAAFF